jgi:uncharacterized membrane protein YdbT with pleckstrin-like domain
VPFPRRLLNDNEDIVLDLHPHWVFLARPAAALVASLALVTVVATGVGTGGDNVAVLAAAALAVVAMLWFAGRYLKWLTTYFVVTTDRLIYRTGVVAKHGREIPLERVNDIGFHQTVLQRLLGAGDLQIESAGERGQDPFTAVAHPAEVQNEIYRQMERAQGRAADRSAGRRELSIPEQLEKLDELRQRGIISEAEFQVKKTQLLDRL